ncbi:MAG TPA: YsnF/AvaK domain-containing protein [Candidatus Angelobacter sp.]|nr:YsnF/AvaK domain-containing protein [Candidatus Angelobacter sp.]
MARGPTTQENADEIVLPLHAEEIAVAKERVVTGRVRIATVTREREELVDELLTREDVEIERRPVGTLVERAPAVRRRGDTIIIPMVEEVLTVTRRLMVKEEIRIRLVHRKEKSRQRVTLRRQEAIIDRIPAATRGPPA